MDIDAQTLLNIIANQRNVALDSAAASEALLRQAQARIIELEGQVKKLQAEQDPAPLPSNSSEE
jgi:hypothetical protein